MEEWLMKLILLSMVALTVVGCSSGDVEINQQDLLGEWKGKMDMTFRKTRDLTEQENGEFQESINAADLPSDTLISLSYQPAEKCYLKTVLDPTLKCRYDSNAQTIYSTETVKGITFDTGYQIRKISKDTLVLERETNAAKEYPYLRLVYSAELRKI